MSSFRCPPSDIPPSAAAPSDAPPEVLPQRSPLRPLPSDVFPTDSLPEMSSLRSPPLDVLSTDVPLRHPLPLDICPQTSSFRGILSCPSSSQCPQCRAVRYDFSDMLSGSGTSTISWFPCGTIPQRKWVLEFMGSFLSLYMEF